MFKIFEKISFTNSSINPLPAFLIFSVKPRTLVFIKGQYFSLKYIILNSNFYFNYYNVNENNIYLRCILNFVILLPFPLQ